MPRIIGPELDSVGWSSVGKRLTKRPATEKGAMELEANKRRKDKENARKEQPEKPPRKRIFQYEWHQSDAEVTVSLNVGDNVDVNSVVLKCDDHRCDLWLPNGRFWQANFFQAVVGEGTSLQTKGKNLLLKLVKKIPNQNWQHLEMTKSLAPLAASSDLATKQDKDEAIHRLQHVKHAWYEKQGNLVNVTVYVRMINKDSLQVHFEPQLFSVKFQTSDSKFLELHAHSTADTYFYWIIALKDQILPDQSFFSLKQTVLDVVLKKEGNGRWGALEAPQKEVQGQTVPSNTWVPASSPANPVATDSRKSAEGSVVANSRTNRSQGESVDSRLQAGESNRKDAGSKPTCMVSPLNQVKRSDQSLVVGLTGLDNLGNTCFMNSVIQCLANTLEFRDYFLGTLFQPEINTNNPLGTGGKLAIAFAILLRVLWSGAHKSYAPSKLKNLISLKASQFTGFAQHDAQEFMAFLLDGLHEDLNRIKKKPYTENIDSDGRPDEVVADESWDLYKQRNDSVVVDLFQGQYKSKLVCPVCSKVSITFDPFLYLSVPLPKKRKIMPVVFFTKDPNRKPIKYILKLTEDATVEELKGEVAKRTGIQTANLRVFEVLKSKIQKFLDKGSNLSTVSANSTVVVFEVLAESLAGEPVVEIAVIQRIVMPHPVTKCSSCKRDCPPGGVKLKRCTKCYRVGYCDQSCQKSHWSQHKANCKPNPELVGCPFLISLPESQATFAKLYYLMEAFARFSVDVFQPPIKLHENLSRNSSGGLSSASDVSSGHSAIGGSDSSLSTSVTSIGSSSSSVNQMSDSPAVAAEADEGRQSLNTKEDKEINEKEVGENSAVENKVADSNQACAVEKGSLSEVESTTNTTSDKPTKTPEEQKDLASSQSSQREVTSCPSTPQPLTRVVFGQSHDEVGERLAPLFVTHTMTQSGQHLAGNDGNKLEDKGDEPVYRAGRYFLAMDWQNNEKLKSYVLVQSKDLEFDMEEGSAAAARDDWCSYFLEPSHISLEQCLQLFMEPETLAPDEAWYCPQCKAHREATKQMSLWRLPPILIVQLKRFSFKNLIWRDKIDKMVEFPVRDLDLGQFYCGPSCPSGSPTYDLYAVINHHGSILGGHYTSFARLVNQYNTRRSDVGWRLFDDSRVTCVSESDVVTRAAYVLFYRRRGTGYPLCSPVSSSVSLNAKDIEEAASATAAASCGLDPLAADILYDDDVSIMDTNRLSYSGDYCTPNYFSVMSGSNFSDMDAVD